MVYRRFLSGRCVSADAATDLTVFDVLGLARSFAVLLAALFDVDSGFFGLILVLSVGGQ